MTTLLTLFWLVTPPVEVFQTHWAQVAPVHRPAEDVRRTPGQARAVVLIPGLSPHPFSSSNVNRAPLQNWQLQGSTLVKAVARDADVYAFAYGQNIAIEHIARSESFRRHILQLRDLGYDDIVLVGHSAGGIIARQFVEDHPKAGVTKVVQVCTPNGGSGWAAAPIFVRSAQEAFLESLTKEARRAAARRRAEIRIPMQVEFVCLVGHYEVDVDLSAQVSWMPLPELGLDLAVKAAGDGLIATPRQWTSDLQNQGIPAVCLPIGHFRMVRSTKGAKTVALLVRDKQPRWSATEVKAFQERLGLVE